MDRELGRRSVVLWGGIGVHKLGVLVFSFALGRLGGAAAVGVMASVLAVSWVVGTLAGMGLPDRVTFAAAARTGQGSGLSPDEGSRHGVYLVAIAAMHVLLFLLAFRVAGTADPQLGRLAQGLVIGAGLQASAAYPFCARRGQGRPQVEAGALVLAGLALAGGFGVGTLAGLGAVWASAAAIQAVAGWAVSWTTPGLWMRWPGAIGPAFRAGLPWLGFGVGAWLVGNIDVLLARSIGAPEAVGWLQVGTMGVRAGGVAPWVVATLSLHQLEARAQRGLGLPWPRIALWAVGLSTVIAGAAWVLMPWLAAGHGLAVETVRVPTLAAVACTPALVTALLLLPIAAARNLPRTLVVILIGLGVGVGIAMVRPLQLGISDCIVAAGASQWVVTLGLLGVLGAARAR